MKKICSLKKLFLSEINDEITKYHSYPSAVFTEEDIKPLPLPVRNCIRNSGFIGKKKMANARIIWKDVFFKRNEKAGWLKLGCWQFNSVPEPCRIVYMKSRLFGLFSFEGRDKYQDGKGNMFIKLLKILTITNAKSQEMDISALVTTLAETFLLPSQALQSYIKWAPVDDFNAKATITFAGKEVSGIFEFNDKFEMARFVTYDRYQSQKDNSNLNIKWAGIASNYCQKDGIKFPSSFKAVWYQETGELEYFRGTIDNVLFDVSEIIF